MNFNKIKIVASREFLIRVRKKSFIIMTILAPVLLAALAIAPTLIMLAGKKGKTDVQNVLVIDQSNLIANSFTDTKDKTFTFSQEKNIDSLVKNFDKLGVDVLVSISELDENNNVDITAYSYKQLTSEDKSYYSNRSERIIRDYKLKNYEIEDLDAIINDINKSVPVENYIIGEDGEAKKSIVEINMFISLGMGMLIYFFIFSFGSMVMQSVLNEKTNKVVEVIVSSIKPFDLMIGKIVGVASVAITQFFIWIILTGLIFIGFQSTIGKKMLMDQLSDTTSQTLMTQQGMDLSGMNFTELADAAGQENLSEILKTISNIDFGYIIINFIIYFILGYLLYAALFAAIGSAVENETDSQQLILPITAPILIGFFIMMQTFNNPDSALSVWASIIPFTSPIVMLARIPFEGGVPTWQLLTSIGALFVTFLFAVYLSGKIYRVGILMHGKKVTWKDLYKWLKY